MKLKNRLSNGQNYPLFVWMALTVVPALGQTGTTQSRLVQDPNAVLWTRNGNVVPMCWHELLQFPNQNAVNDAKAFVMQTIQEGWIDRVNLRITWVNCPVSGTQQHVRVKLRIGDASNNGTTKQVGMATLSIASQRVIQPPNDPPGLLMGFRADWNTNDATRAGFRSLILHEFGHILGFDHEQIRNDGPPGVPCYTNAFPNAIKIGPADPQSIMGWSYCTQALGVLTAGDISGARAVYGRGDIITPDFPALLQLHDTGAIWSFTGAPCSNQACPGWALIDKNPRTESISGNYQRHVDGKICAGMAGCGVPAMNVRAGRSSMPIRKPRPLPPVSTRRIHAIRTAASGDSTVARAQPRRVPAGLSLTGIRGPRTSRLASVPSRSPISISVMSTEKSGSGTGGRNAPERHAQAGRSSTVIRRQSRSSRRRAPCTSVTPTGRSGCGMGNPAAAPRPAPAGG